MGTRGTLKNKGKLDDDGVSLMKKYHVSYRGTYTTGHSVIQKQNNNTKELLKLQNKTKV